MLPTRDPLDREHAVPHASFEDDLQGFHGCSGIGCISDTDPQPLLVRSHLGTFGITTVGAINNAEELVEKNFASGGRQFMAMSSGKVNTTELVAALINQKDDFVSGIKHAQESIDGSLTLLIITQDGQIIAARDKVGRLPVLIGKSDDGFCISFESFAYHKLGYRDEYELGPGEIVLVNPDEYRTISPAGDKMKICAFLWVYYGYPNSNYEGVNVEVMRYRNGAIMARDEAAAGGAPELDYVAGVPDSGVPHAIGYATECKTPFARPFIKYTPTWARSFMPSNQEVRNRVAKMKQIHIPELINEKEAAVRGRFHRARHAAERDGGLPVQVRRRRSAYALGLPAHHVQLQVPELLQQPFRHGAARTPHGGPAGRRGGRAAPRRVRRRLHRARQVHVEIHLRADGLRFARLPVARRHAGSHRHRSREGVHVLLDRQGITPRGVYLPQHFLYFLPLPQGQGSLRPTFMTSPLSL